VVASGAALGRVSGNYQDPERKTERQAMHPFNYQKFPSLSHFLGSNLASSIC
jgi:hypothetical protein